MTGSPERDVVLQEQASTVRAEFPELYEHLRRRDEQLLRFLARIPSPADLELSATADVRARLETIRTSLATGGIADLES